MSKIAAIGEKDILLCFKGVGVEVFPVMNPEEGLAKLRELSFDKEYGIIMITESIVMNFLNELHALQQKANTIILVIPTHQGSANTSLMEMKRIVERSVGIDLILKGE